MGVFSVINNVSSLVAQQQSTATGVGLQKTLFRLSSGLRIRTGGDDAAGLAIADGLRGQIASLSQSVRNANDGIGSLQTADSALAQTSNLLTRAATILTEAATDTNAGQLSAISNELGQLLQEVDRVGTGTRFNGAQVFTNTTRNIFVGDTQIAGQTEALISFTASALSTNALGLSLTGAITSSGSSLAVNLTSTSQARTLLSQVELAIDNVAQRRGTLGSKINRLENSIGVISAQVQNLTAAESQIRDANIAEEVANLTRFQILSQSGISALAQANNQQQSVLALLR